MTDPTDDTLDAAPAEAGPTTPAGVTSVPMWPSPPGTHLTPWHVGGQTALWLIYPADKYESVMEWAEKLGPYLVHAVSTKEAYRIRSIERAKQKALASGHPAVQPQAVPQGQVVRPPAAPQQPAVHKKRPSALVNQAALTAEALEARARVDKKKLRDEAHSAMERYAATPEGTEEMRRMVADADAKRAKAHPPGSVGAAVAPPPPATAPAPPPIMQAEGGEGPPSAASNGPVSNGTGSGHLS
jgi:hypothetical protein